MPRVRFEAPHEGSITVGGGGVSVEFIDGYADAPESAWAAWQSAGAPIVLADDDAEEMSSTANVGGSDDVSESVVPVRRGKRGKVLTATA